MQETIMKTSKTSGMILSAITVLLAAITSSAQITPKGTNP